MIKNFFRSFSTKSQLPWYGALALVLSYAFLLRVINLDYNTPFIDEASSVIIGRMGVFQNDWHTYNAINWFSGHPFFEPVISGITYSVAGITGSRFINVVLGVLTIEAIAVLAVLLTAPVTFRSYLAGLIAGGIVASSSVALYVSRLATYDMKSFFLLVLSLVVLVFTTHTKKNLGKWYFLAFIFLFLSVMAKIIALMYVPLFIGYSYVYARKDTSKNYYWKRYFLIPIMLVTGVYVTLMLPSIITFGQLQATKETRDTLFILQRIAQVIPYELIAGAIGAVLMLVFRQGKLLVALLLGAVWILLSHFVTGRAVETMDKHLFVTIVFLAVIAGIGAANLITASKYTAVRAGMLLAAFALLAMFSFKSYALSQQYNDLWLHSGDATVFLQSHVKSNETILTETGEPVILSLYETNFPANVTTFNWFEYRKKSGTDAYAQAVADGNFHWIELLSDDFANQGSFVDIRKTVKANMKDNYTLVHSSGYSEVYRRNF